MFVYPWWWKQSRYSVLSDLSMRSSGVYDICWVRSRCPLFEANWAERFCRETSQILSWFVQFCTFLPQGKLGQVLKSHLKLSPISQLRNVAGVGNLGEKHPMHQCHTHPCRASFWGEMQQHSTPGNSGSNQTGTWTFQHENHCGEVRLRIFLPGPKLWRAYMFAGCRVLISAKVGLETCRHLLHVNQNLTSGPRVAEKSQPGFSDAKIRSKIWCTLKNAMEHFEIRYHCTLQSLHQRETGFSSCQFMRFSSGFQAIATSPRSLVCSCGHGDL